MSGPQRNADKVNTIGIVVVGICGAVLVYVSIVALQAFYMSDTSEVNTMADYGGQDLTARSIRSEQSNAILTYGWNREVDLHGQPTARIGIDHAMELVAKELATDPKNANDLVPALGPAVTPTILPRFGRPTIGGGPAAAGGPATATGGPTAAPSGPTPGTGTAVEVTAPSVPMTPTGGAGPGGGAPPGASSSSPIAAGMSKPSDQQPATAGSGK